MLQICFLALKMKVKHGWTNIEQIFNKYWTCVVVLYCFVSSRAQCPIWSHDDVDGANGRFQANLEDLEAECLTNVPYLLSPCLSLSLSLWLGTSFSPCFSVSRAGAVCATGPLGISGPRSASCNFSITFLTSHPSHRESLPTLPQEEKLPEEPRVLHRCSTAPENSRAPVGHILNIASTTRPETRALTKFSIGTALEPSLDFIDWTRVNWSGVGISLCHFTSIDCSCSSDFFCLFPYCQQIRDFWLLGSSCSVFA